MFNIPLLTFKLYITEVHSKTEFLCKWLKMLKEIKIIVMYTLIYCAIYSMCICVCMCTYTGYYTVFKIMKHFYKKPQLLINFRHLKKKHIVKTVLTGRSTLITQLNSLYPAGIYSSFFLWQIPTSF